MKTETTEELGQIVVESEAALRARWENHGSREDLLVLADWNREECRPYIRQQHKHEEVDGTLTWAEVVGRRPMFAYNQPAERLIDALARDGDPSHRETARELTRFTRYRDLGIVPLLVVVPGGLWATIWSAPGSRISVLRCNADEL